MKGFLSAALLAVMTAGCNIPTVTQKEAGRVAITTYHGAFEGCYYPDDATHIADYFDRWAYCDVIARRAENAALAKVGYHDPHALRVGLLETVITSCLKI